MNCRFGGHTVRLALLPLLLWVGSASALDWPYYRGPSHNGVSTETIPSSFPPEGPTILWKVPLDPAFSSFTVAGSRVFTQARRSINDQLLEVCLALNAADGSELWSAPVDNAVYPDGQAGADDGPRSTPCVDGDTVFVLTSYLKLVKLNALNGTVLWVKDLQTLYAAQLVKWQNGASPVLGGDLLFLNCGSPTNSLLALRKSDGELAWRSGAEAMTHATPTLTTILDVPQLIFFTQSGLVSVAPATGQELWRYPFPYNTSAAASPVVDGDIVYCSAAWGIGAGAVRISRVEGQWQATELWRNEALMNEFSTPVCFQGTLYGLFGRSWSSTGPLKCIDLATGAELWSEPGFGPGGLLLVADKLLVTDDRGGLILVEPFPRTYNELGRFQALSGKCWNAPALSRGCLYMRSTSEAVCLRLAEDTSPAPLVQSLTPLPSGLLRLSLTSSDNSPIDSSRLARIEVRSSSDLSLPLASWPTLSNPLLWVDGAIQVDLEPTHQARYFMAIERPSN